MSLTLQQSCRLYERQARRSRQTPPSMEAFNAAHDASLPTSSKALKIHKRFCRALAREKKIHGVPLNVPLPSLYKALHEETDGEVRPKVFRNVAEHVPTRVSSISKRAPVVGRVPRVQESVSQIFAPAAAEAPKPEKEVSLEDAALAALDEAEDPVEAYKAQLEAWLEEHPESKLAKGSQVVHFVDDRATAFQPEETSAKMTRTTGAALKQLGGEFRVRSGAKRVFTNLFDEDVNEVVRSMKQGVKGPYFVRII